MNNCCETMYPCHCCQIMTLLPTHGFPCSRLPLRTRHTGAQRHEGDGGDGVLQAHRAAEVRGQVADDGGENANPEYGEYKTQITGAHV